MADLSNAPEDLKRLLQYFPLLTDGQRVALYPEPDGLPHNDFTIEMWNGSHFRIKSSITGDILYVPYSLIEFASPGPNGTIIRLRRQMKYDAHQKALL